MGAPQRLTIAIRRGAEPTPGWVELCRHVFTLDDAAARRFWSAAPLSLVLVNVEDKEREPLLRRLGAAGTQPELSPVAGRPRACEKHRRLEAADVCPRCGERRACPACTHAFADSLCPPCARRADFRVRFKRARVMLLLMVLVVVAGTIWQTKRRIASWKHPLSIGIIPVNVDSDPAVAAWTARLEPASFQPMADFFQREAARRGVAITPVVRLHVAKPQAATVRPPPPPEDVTPLNVVLWSLKLRWWQVGKAKAVGLPKTKVQIYVLYHSPSSDEELEHSLGIEKIRLGVVHTHAGAEDAGWTQVAIAHELLHTIGAKDKYGVNGMPVFPDGYADPKQVPLHPQQRAELMAGQIPTGDASFVQARSLRECMVGDSTAREIGWSPAVVR